MVHATAAQSKVLVAALDLDRTFAALSDPTRRAVLGVLRRGPRRAGEIAHDLRMSAPALSRHLKILRGGGLIEGSELEHDARVRVYQLAPGALRELRRWVGELEAYWGEQLASFEQHVARLEQEP